jgi:hypothetical protein
VSESTPGAVASELVDRLGGSDVALVVLFASPTLDRVTLAAEVRARFGDTPVIGCTTAGEIGPCGLAKGSVSGFSLPASSFRVACERIPDVACFDVSAGGAMVSRLRAELSRHGPFPSAANCFALLLIDGLTVREEAVVGALSNALVDIQLAGGSAGDGLDFGSTAVLADGAFSSSSAVLALIQTDRPFVPIKIQHFVPDSEKMVVTGADATRRIVFEINGDPAGQEYARLVGLDPSKLTAMAFATHPVIVQVGGKPYVRSIQKVNPDGSLTFFCAIDEGIVLTLGRGEALVDNLESALSRVTGAIGPPDLVIGFDCILRRLEIERTGTECAVSRLFAEHRVVGFSTYGEQFNAMHVNQTFTGVAIGAPPCHP